MADCIVPACTRRGKAASPRGCPLPGTARVNGLKDADLRDAPKFVDVLEQVMALNDYLYLLAHCHLRDEERNFRLDRIENMNVEK